jgi:transcriptional regulator with XRE-family HTH domain
MTLWTIHSGADFGRAISAIRHRRGLTQAELAEQCGLARSYLAHLETGRTSSSLEHILRLLRRSGARVTVEWPRNRRDDTGLNYSGYGSTTTTRRADPS